jgi:hypothetical protein
MKAKQIVILAIIFGILAAAIFLKSWVRSADDHAAASRGGMIAFAGFDPARLERILVGRGNQAPAVELAKENGVWKVKSLWSAKADLLKVEKLIQKFRSIQGELRGSGKKLFEDFGIQEGNAFSLQFLGVGDVSLQDLRIGTKQAGEKTCFVREDQSENVYLVNADMEELFGIYTALSEAVSASLFWADLSLLNLDPEKVTEITVHLLKGEEQMMRAGLERETNSQEPLKSSWEFLRQGMPSSPDPDKVLKFIAAMNSVRAEKIMDPSGKEYGLEKPVWRLAVTEDGQTRLLEAGPKDKKGELFYVRRSGDPTIFGLKTSFFDDLDVDDTHFIKDVPPATGSEKDLLQSSAAVLTEGQKQTT